MNLNLTSNKELRAKALAKLSGKWTPAVLIGLVTIGVAFASLMLLYLPYFFVAPVLIVGLFGAFLNSVRSESEVKISDLFDAFKNNYGKNLKTIWLMIIYIYLWCLLFFIPGLIKQYSYAMTPYILKDEPELGANAIIEKSMAMMSGNKMKLFMLDLSFIGWILLSMLTLNIGLLWVMPYMYTARAEFYEDVKKAQQAQIEA